MTRVIHAIQHMMIEWGYHSAWQCRDPFNEIEMDVMIKNEEGHTWKVPAFWAGETNWRVRFAAPEPGAYEFQTSCSDRANSGLHGQKGILEVEPYQGNNPLLKHGSLRIAQSKRTFEFSDGTSFFWLGDTWWYGLCQRWSWPKDFKIICDDRVKKGFSVIQLVAGLPPDAKPFEEKIANEGGHPWENNFERINPRYFDMADLRIDWLIQCGLMPCILGSWGFYMMFMGLEKLKKHWRYMIARWGALPVIWCVAGEATMPYYTKLIAGDMSDSEPQRKGWTEIARYLCEIDPFKNLVTIHPQAIFHMHGRSEIEDDSLIDFEMLQTGHFEREITIKRTVKEITAAYARTPVMPVINSEVVYEGHMQQHWQDEQRFMFWSCVLSGAAGHTYGAGGIWQINTREKPFGPTPHPTPHTYENTPWDEAMHLPGSRQLGLGRRLLERYRWWLMEPHPEWTMPQFGERNYMLPYAAGIPEKLRIIYIPQRIYDWTGPLLKYLEDGVFYRAYYFNPLNGDEYPLSTITADDKNTWQAPDVPLCQDWVLVLEKERFDEGLKEMRKREKASQKPIEAATSVDDFLKRFMVESMQRSIMKNAVPDDAFGDGITMVIDIGAKPYSYILKRGREISVSRKDLKAPMMRLLLSSQDMEKMLVEKDSDILMPFADLNSDKIELIKKLNGTLVFKLMKAENSIYQCKIVFNGVGEPSSAVTLPLLDYRSVMSRETSMVNLYIDGRLTLEGDMAIAAEFQKFFL